MKDKEIQPIELKVMNAEEIERYANQRVIEELERQRDKAKILERTLGNLLSIDLEYRIKELNQ